MKKNIVSLMIISAILLLVGWTQIEKAFATQEPMGVASTTNLRWEIPDYPADGKLYYDMYRKNMPSSVSLEAPDYLLDAEFFNDWYRDISTSSPHWIPDYPLDGKLFAEQYSTLP